MNASQRRTLFRASVRALSALGIVPGATVERKAPGKAHATQATVETIGRSDTNRARPVLLVRRRDNRVASWNPRDLVNPARLRDVSKGHALRLSA